MILKILILEWNSFCNEDMEEAFQRCGHTTNSIPFDDREDVDKQNDIMLQGIDSFKPDIVFSFNYFPEVSNLCKNKGVKYVGWVYDSPYLNLYSYTITNECNSVFVFDYAVYEEFALNGISTVHYLPMAVNSQRLLQMGNPIEMKKKHSCDISFVGSLYTEPKHDLYAKFDNIDEFTKGYLDGIIQAQLRVYGMNFLESMLTDNIIEQMQEAYPTNPNAMTVATPKFIYADYVLSRKVTGLERHDVIRRLSDLGKMHLYTNDSNVQIGHAYNCGRVDYYKEMPYVFKNSSINLNITLRSIKTGIPLRAMDIMGCGGFLLSNYQQEYMEYFEPDKDFVYYEDMGDMEEKVKFYLKNGQAREKIAKNGFEKVRKDHSFVNRVSSLLEE